MDALHLTSLQLINLNAGDVFLLLFMLHFPCACLVVERQGRVRDLIYFVLYKAKLIMFPFFCEAEYSHSQIIRASVFWCLLCVCDEHFGNFIHSLLQDLNP